MSYRKHLMTSDEPPSELYKAVELGTNLAEVGTDCISRQAAIDTISKLFIPIGGSFLEPDEKKLYDNGVDDALQEIKQLPPVFATDINVGAKDTISRKAAIEALSNEIVKRRLLDEMYDGCIDEFQTEEILKKLPPAQPEPSQVAKDITRILENGQDMRVIAQGRIRGRWIIRETSSGDTEARCSHCGFTTLVDEPGNGLHMVSDLNFCPNCGADMREVTT